MEDLEVPGPGQDLVTAAKVSPELMVYLVLAQAANQALDPEFRDLVPVAKECQYPMRESVPVSAKDK